MSYIGTRSDYNHPLFGIPNIYQDHYSWLKALLENAITYFHNAMKHVNEYRTTLTTRSGVRDVIISLDKIQNLVREKELQYITDVNKSNEINNLLTNIDNLLEQAKIIYNTILTNNYRYRWDINQSNNSATAVRYLEPGYNNTQRRERNLQYKKIVGWYPPVTLLSSLPEVTLP